MSPAEFHFLRPLWLWMLLPLALLLWRLAARRGEREVWRSLVDPHLLSKLLVEEGGAVRRLPLLLLGAGWLLLVLALAGPTWQRLPAPVYQAQQYRVLALDISPSMNATDLTPTRLVHARYELLDLLHRAREGQTALLAYGAEPYLVSPLTTDSATIAAQVPGLATDLLPVSGAKRTDLALAQAGDLLRQAGAPDGEVILITDNLAHPAAALEAVRKLRAEGYRVSVLGVGTAHGAPVQVAGGGFLKDKSGAILMPNLDVESLRTLASAGGGLYVTASPDDQDTNRLLAAAPGARQGARQRDSRGEQWREEGVWLLLLLLPIALLAFRRGWMSPLMLLLLFSPLPPEAHAMGWDDLWLRSDQQAARQLEAGRPAEAVKLFRQPDWRAAAQYQAGDYAQALRTLQARQGAQTQYNRGNTLAHLGRLEDALKAYDGALKADPRDADARHNRDLVQALLDRRKSQAQSRPSDGAQQKGRQGQPQQPGGQGLQGQQAQQGKSGRQGEHSRQGRQGEQARRGKAGEPGQQAQQGRPGEQPQQGKGGQGKQEQQAKQSAQGPQAQSAASGKSGKSGKEDAGRSLAAGPKAQQPPAPQGPTQAPGPADLLDGRRKPDAGRVAANPAAGGNPEQAQAMEQMLRQVEDDPGGLLRQRFLLQHLRRTGQL